MTVAAFVATALHTTTCCKKVKQPSSIRVFHLFPYVLP